MSKKTKVTASGVRLQQGSVQVDADFVEPAVGAGLSKPSALIAQGYEIIKASIEPGGLALLLGKGRDMILTRMVQTRDGAGIDSLVVTFVAKVP